MKKLLFTAFVAAFVGMLHGQQATFRHTEVDRMNRESSDLGKWYVNPGGGFMWWQGSMNVKRTGYAHLRLGVDANDFLSFEFGGLVAPFIVNDANRAWRGKPKHTMWGHTRDWRGVGQMYGGTVDALFHIDRENRYFDPYVRLGMGLYGASEHIFGDNYMAFVPRAGVGFQSHLTENLALRAECLAHSFITDDWNWGGSVELGLVYHFGDSGAPAKPAPTPRPRPTPATPPSGGGLVNREVIGDTVRLTYDLNFAYDSSVIDPKFFAALDEAVDTLQQYPNATATIEGHADRTSGGSGAAYNRNLSQQRADKVREYVNGKGIDADRLQSRGFGFDMPKFTPASNPQNRRVEIIIRGVK